MIDLDQNIFSSMTNKGMEENNLLYEFPKTMTKPVILFGKRAGNFLPAPKYIWIDIAKYFT